MELSARKNACLFKKGQRNVYEQKTRQGRSCADCTAKQCVLNIIIPLAYRWWSFTRSYSSLHNVIQCHAIMRYYAVRTRPTSSPVGLIGSIQTTPFRMKPYGKSVWCFSNHRLGLTPYSKSSWCYPNNSFQTQTIG